jgi:lipopolysaccharide biosynthesis regulator YciM
VYSNYGDVSTANQAMHAYIKALECDATAANVWLKLAQTTLSQGKWELSILAGMQTLRLHDKGIFSSVTPMQMEAFNALFHAMRQMGLTLEQVRRVLPPKYHSVCAHYDHVRL